MISYLNFALTVKSIVERVDEVFKKRKEECILLVWKITDLQNELSQVEYTTNSYAERAALKGTELNWLRESSQSLETEAEFLKTSRFDSISQLISRIETLNSKGMFIIHLNS